MLLKLMIDLFFYGSILSFFFIIIFGMSTGSFNIGGQTFQGATPTIIIYMIFTVLRPFFFFLSVFHIKRLADRFIKVEIF